VVLTDWPWGVAMTTKTKSKASVLKGKWRKFLSVLPRDSEGWWLNAEPLEPKGSRWGPWDTKDEALEVRRSYLRNAVDKPWLKER
jgi:hypothetical protein